ncbi:PAS domain S-box protein [Oscillochloris sp. ZM17-4]|nr:PAS domain S-box protein [Oscillochloris sp. ZM17-4]MBX0327641.1 PAS domain S-box protein [Oscillochloris sp. ZM17-4]
MRTLLDSNLLPADRSFADTQEIFGLTRRATLNQLRPLFAEYPEAGVTFVDRLSELLGAAREAEVNWQIENAQRRADAQAAELRAALYRMEQSFATSPLANIEADNHGIITRWNRAAERIFGWGAAEAIGRNAIELLVPNLAREQVEQVVGALLSGNANNSRNENTTKSGRMITCQWYNAVLYNTDGSVAGWLSQTEDITEQLQAEQERVALQEQVIEAQQATLRELSTPIIPIGDGAVAMPLIGNIDSMRAQLVIETLLEGVATSRARIAILDITGVQVVDTQVANALLRAAQAVKLLGAQVIITGIRPEVAQTLVGLGLDLSSIRTLSTLQSGIAYALAAGRR